MDNEILIKDLIFLLQTFSRTIREIIDLVYGYDIEQSYELLIELTENYMGIENIIGEDANINSVFNLIMEAMSNHDYVLIADLLQFELLVGTENLIQELEQSIEV